MRVLFCCDAIDWFADHQIYSAFKIIDVTQLVTQSGELPSGGEFGFVSFVMD